MRTGSLVPYTTNYAELLSELPALTLHYATDYGSYSVAMPSAGSSPFRLTTLAEVLWNGANYVMMPYVVSTASGSPYYRIKNSLNAAGSTGNFSTANVPLTTYCFQNNVVVAGISTPGGTKGLCYLPAGSSNTAFSVSSGAVPTDSRKWALACNGTNRVVGVGAGLATASTIAYSIDNGANFSTATGSLSVSGSIVNIHWSPCAGKFLTYGDDVAMASANIFILASTDGYTNTAVMSPNSAYGVSISSYPAGYQHTAASSNTVTLLGVRQVSTGTYGFLRTTNGVTFTFVDPIASAKVFYDSLGQGLLTVQWDSVRSRFVAWFAASTTAFLRTATSAYLYSSDGNTWTASPAVATVDSQDQILYGFSNANNQDIVLTGVGSASGVPNRMYSASQFVGNPSHVGIWPALTGEDATNAFKYYIRIK